jgi:Cdc6-like AAA superfamily ATPase
MGLKKAPDAIASANQFYSTLDEPSNNNSAPTVIFLDDNKHLLGKIRQINIEFCTIKD